MESRQLTVLRNHNESVGTPFQRLVQCIVVRYVIGPFIHLALRILLRIEVRGEERLLLVGERAIFAPQHFFEWDPFITYYASLWKAALSAEHLVNVAVTSPLWTRTWPLRTLSWVLGLMGTIRGYEPHQGAIERAGRLLLGQAPLTVAFFPTGPIGKKKSYQIYPGVAQLANLCVEVPVVPVSVAGIQDLDWRSVLTFRRPRIVISVGDSFCAGEIDAATEAQKVAIICRRIRSEWEKHGEYPAEVTLPESTDAIWESLATNK